MGNHFYPIHSPVEAAPDIRSTEKHAMTPEDEALFRKAADSLPPAAALELHLTSDPRSSRLEQFCNRLCALMPALRVAREQRQGPGPPALVLPAGLRFLGVPTGAEAAPFSELLTGRTPAAPPEILARIAAMALPAALDVFVLPRCTYCPTAVRRLAPLAAASPLIRLCVIDGALFPELADRDRIQSVPTAVLDGRFRWSGAISLEEVAALLVTRDPADIGPVSLELMLKEGSAQRVAEMMCERNAVFPALLELMRHAQWPVRLGAMVAIEALSGLSPALGREALERLWGGFEAEPEPVQGDILFLSGEVGGAWLRPAIRRAIRQARSAEIKEAAAEALEKVGGGGGPP